MTQFLLSSEPLTVTKIKKRSSAKLLKDVKVGDVLKISLRLDAPGRSRRGAYATYVKVENLTQGTSDVKSLNILSDILYKIFELSIQEEGTA